MKQKVREIFNRHKAEFILMGVSGVMLIYFYRTKPIELFKGLLQWVFIGTTAIVIDKEINMRLEVIENGKQKLVP